MVLPVIDASTNEPGSRGALAEFSTAVLSKEIGLSVQLLGCKWRDVGYSPKYKKYITKSSRPEINQKITYDSILYNKVLSYQPRIN